MLVPLHFDNLITLVSDLDFRKLLLDSVLGPVSLPALQCFRRGEHVGGRTVSGRIGEDGVAWSCGVAAISSSIESRDARSLALFDTLASSAETKAFCFDLSKAFQKRGGSPVIVSGLDFCHNYGMNLSDLADSAPVVVGRMLLQFARNHSHCIFVISASCSLSWARECVCVADTILLLEHEAGEEETEEGDEFTVLAAIPTRSKHVAREVVVIRQVVWKWGMFVSDA